MTTILDKRASFGVMGLDRMKGLRVSHVPLVNTRGGEFGAVLESLQESLNEAFY